MPKAHDATKSGYSNTYFKMFRVRNNYIKNPMPEIGICILEIQPISINVIRKYSLSHI